MFNLKAYEYLEKNISVFLKRINYKSKSCLNLECNEVVYRIYALSLKRLPTLNEDDLQSLISFLEGFIEFKFVTIHDDFLLNETTAFLESEVFSKSVQLNQMPNKGKLYSIWAKKLWNFFLLILVQTQI